MNGTDRQLNAIVTGGSVGIGADICRTLLGQGYGVINLSRRRPDIDSPELIHFSVDLCDRGATKEVAQEIAAKHSVAVLIHNAGAIRPALLPEVNLDDLDDLVNLHLASFIILTQAVLPAMKECNYGRIVGISSRGALGLQTRTAYSATKAGMIGMARTWALELAPLGITVNSVAPGPIATDMFYEIVPRDSEAAATFQDRLPVRRLGMPRDVTQAVMFLIDSGSGFITGQTIYVCGGTSIGSLQV